MMIIRVKLVKKFIISFNINQYGYFIRPKKRMLINPRFKSVNI